jgi:imidazolonepropionase-like amidohydrolase
VNHVTVINPKASPVEDRAIVLSGSRIAAIDSAAEVHIPPGAQIIDGRGKFVVPGLADMHHHLLSGTLTVSPADVSSRSRRHDRCARRLRNPSQSRRSDRILRAVQSGRC